MTTALLNLEKYKFWANMSIVSDPLFKSFQLSHQPAYIFGRWLIVQIYLKFFSCANFQMPIFLCHRIDNILRPSFMLDCSTNLGNILKTRFVFYLGDADVGMPSQLDTGQCNIALDSIGQRGKNDLPSKNTYTTYNLQYHLCLWYLCSIGLFITFLGTDIIFFPMFIERQFNK